MSISEIKKQLGGWLPIIGLVIALLFFIYSTIGITSGVIWKFLVQILDFIGFASSNFIALNALLFFSALLVIPIIYYLCKKWMWVTIAVILIIFVSFNIILITWSIIPHDVSESYSFKQDLSPNNSIYGNVSCEPNMKDRFVTELKITCSYTVKMDNYSNYNIKLLFEDSGNTHPRGFNEDHTVYQYKFEGQSGTHFIAKDRLNLIFNGSESQIIPLITTFKLWDYYESDSRILQIKFQVLAMIIIFLSGSFFAVISGLKNLKDLFPVKKEEETVSKNKQKSHK